LFQNINPHLNKVKLFPKVLEDTISLYFLIKIIGFPELPENVSADFEMSIWNSVALHIPHAKVKLYFVENKTA
jgi:hypothetical protein